MTGLRRILHEVHGRSLWQVLGIYLAASWVALQVVDQIVESLALPPWVNPFAVVLLIIGLPIVLATAFIQQGMSPARRAEPGGSREGTRVPGRSGESAVDSGVAVAIAGAPVESAAAHPATTRRLFTWRNALVGVGLAFALLALATWGFMTMRNRGIGPVGSLVAKGVLDERSPILLADIDGSDVELANAATEALRVDLSQSEIVRLVEPARVTEALARMERSVDARLDESLAREIAVREGIPAVVSGDIDAVGRGFSLTARILSPADGAVLASARASARDSTEVLEAIDDLSRQLRERVGESYGSLRSDPPLEKVTTSSMEALRKFSEAMRLSREGASDDAVIALYEEAVALDSTFASAWRALAIKLGNRFQEPGRQLDAMERANRHRDRLTERERYFVEAAYARNIGDEEGAIRAYESMLRLDPGDAVALNNIGVVHYWRGEHEQAVEYYRRAAALDTMSALTAANVAVALANIGQYEAADSAYRAAARIPGFEPYSRWLAAFPSATGDYEEARRRLDAILERGASDLADREFVENTRGTLDVVRGRFAAAEPYVVAAELSARRISPDHYLSQRVARAGNEMFALRDTARALRTLRTSLEEVPLDSLPASDWPAEWMAQVLAGAGEPDRAEALLDTWLERVDPRLRAMSEERQHAARAAIALARDQPELALEESRRQEPGDCRPCAALGPALAFDAMGHADSAIVYFEEYIGRPYHWRLFPDAAWRGHVLERLGQLYDAKGDREQAAGWYGQFIELWRDADAPLQARVNAARQRVEEIYAERG
jgi:tetratricopeptide (TPR) repeat protein